METNGFIACIKTEYLYVDIATNVTTRLHIWNYESDRPLPKEKNVIGLKKDGYKN